MVTQRDSCVCVKSNLCNKGADNIQWTQPSFGDLKNKNVLLLCDQDSGNDLYFLRYAALAKKRGASLSYCPPKQLLPLVKRSGVIDKLLEDATQKSEQYDYVLNITDLPLIARNDPHIEPLFLHPRKEDIKFIEDRLAECGPGPYLAVTWRSSSISCSKQNYSEEIAIELLAFILKFWSGSVIVVQSDVYDEELDALSTALGRPAHDFSEYSEDSEAMLALMARVEEYVCVSNAHLHVRASLALPTRILASSSDNYSSGGKNVTHPESKTYYYDNIQDLNEGVSQLCLDIKLASKDKYVM